MPQLSPLPCPAPPRPRMLQLCWLVAALLLPGTARADVTIDLANAVFDETLGQFCVTQKVKILYLHDEDVLFFKRN